jgi:hypothetical protein
VFRKLRGSGVVQKGLTAVEVTIVVLILVILLSALIPWMMRRERARWQAIADANPAHAFAIECRPLQESFAPNEPVIIECVVTNTTRWDLYLKWRGISLRSDLDAPGETLYWARAEEFEDVSDLNRAGSAFVGNVVLTAPELSETIGAGESVRFYVSPLSTNSADGTKRSVYALQGVPMTVNGVVLFSDKDHYWRKPGFDLLMSDEISFRIEPRKQAYR